MPGEQKQFYQVVMDGEYSFSAPYQSKDAAEERARVLESKSPGREFTVEAWPNERQETEADADA